MQITQNEFLVLTYYPKCVILLWGDSMNRIHDLRISRGLSMRQAADALDLPYTTYVNYEKGTREPNSETLIKIANFFDVSIDYLIGRIKDTNIDLANGIHIRISSALDEMDKGKAGYDPHSSHIVYQTEEVLIFVDNDASVTEKQISEIINSYRVEPPNTQKKPALTEKDQRDIAKDLEAMMAQLDGSGDLMFDGNPISDEARASIRSALQVGLEIAKVKNKERFTPKKYRKD